MTSTFQNIRQHPLYQIWKGMRARCYDPNHKSFPRYGGRGIITEPEWDDYSNFYNWAVQAGWDHCLSLDRIDNDGPYGPTNCRWVTYKEQANNTSTNVWLVAFGERKTVAQWSDDIRCGVPANTIYQRLEMGWEPELAIMAPSRRSGTRRPLSFDQYQALAEYTALYPGKGTNEGLQYALLGLGSEIGELQGKMKKVLRDANGQISEEKRKELLAEASDVLWYCAAVASELNVSLGSIAESNIQKLADRQERGVIKGSGDNR